jgi:hypothetical protein
MLESQWLEVLRAYHHETNRTTRVPEEYEVQFVGTTPQDM